MTHVHLHQRAGGSSPKYNSASILAPIISPITCDAGASDARTPPRVERMPQVKYMQMPSKAPRIVVVEDDPSMSQAIERILRVGGFTPIVFDSAESALAADAVQAADCLVLDFHLPGMSGFELQERLATPGLPAGRVHDGARRTRRAGAFVSGRRAEPA